MANEFVARKGLIALNDSQITGSLEVTDGITGSLYGTSSWAEDAISSSYALTSSYAENATSWDGIFTGSAEITGSLQISGTLDLHDGYQNLLISSYNTSLSTSSAGYNIAIGSYAGNSLTSGKYNTAIAAGALYNVTNRWDNTAIGGTSLFTLTEGERNTGIGRNTLAFLETGSNNVAIGTRALEGTGSAGPYIYSNTIAIGTQAGRNNNNDNNVFIGHQAGFSNITGSDNVFIGYQAGYNETTSNKLYIANSNTTTPLIFGEFDNNIVRINGKLYVSNSLDVTGSINASGDITSSYFYSPNSGSRTAPTLVIGDPNNSYTFELANSLGFYISESGVGISQATLAVYDGLTTNTWVDMLGLTAGSGPSTPGTVSTLNNNLRVGNNLLFGTSSNSFLRLSSSSDDTLTTNANLNIQQDFSSRNLDYIRTYINSDQYMIDSYITTSYQGAIYNYSIEHNDSRFGQTGIFNVKSPNGGVPIGQNPSNYVRYNSVHTNNNWAVPSYLPGDPFSPSFSASFESPNLIKVWVVNGSGSELRANINKL